MFGISSSYTLFLSFLEYSPKTHVMRFKVRTKPEINGVMRGLLRKYMQKKYPFMKLSGEILRIDLNENRAGEFIKGIQMKNGSVAIKINWR